MENKVVNFATSTREMNLISLIVKRAYKLWKIEDTLSLNMDITATHCNGTPLDLSKLLAADEFNFGHDIFGIMNHINRDNGQLEDCFLPRCSRPDKS